MFTFTTVKHGGGGVMIWAYFAVTGPSHTAVIESVMNSRVAKYSRVRAELAEIGSCNRTMILSTLTNL